MPLERRISDSAATIPWMSGFTDCMDSTPKLEELLSHAAWARRLARTLVTDPNVADDLVQDAYVAAASGAYRSSDAPRGWLATVLRNFARRRHRGETARAARECEVARSELLPGADDRFERAQIEHALSAAVLALDEPYRDTLLLRFFEGLSSAEIARRHGVPEATVRSRLARALEQLRWRLDRERGGREAWMAAFVANFAPSITMTPTSASNPLSVPISIAASVGGLIAMKWFTGLVVLAGLGWIVWSSAPGVEPLGSVPAPVTHASAAMLEPTKAETPLADESRVAPPTSVSPASSSADARTVVQGRCVDGSGRPVAGAHVALHATERVQFAVVDRALDAPGNDVAATTDAGGRFTLRVDPPSTYRFAISWTAEGRAPGVRDLGILERASVRNAGAIRCLALATARVRVVAADGRALSSGWSIAAHPRESDTDHRSVHAETALADGSFLLEGLSEGRWRVEAEHVSGTSTRAEVMLQAQRENEVTLRYTGIDPSTVLTVDVRARFLARWRMSPDAITLSGSGVTDLHPAPVEGSISRFRYCNLAPGDYAVRIDDPRFEPFESAAVRPGTTVIARLRGNARVRLALVDSAGATWTQPFQVTVRGLGPGAAIPVREDWFPLTALEDGTNAGTVFALPSEPVQLRVVSAGSSPVVFDLPNLSAGETCRLVARMTAGTRIAGRALEADRETPLHDASVGLFRPAQREDSPSSRWIALPPGASTSRDEFFRQRVAEARTDDQGAFAFEAIVPGSYFIRVEAGPGRFAASELVTVAQDEVRGDVLLVASPAATLRVSVRTPESSATSDLRLLLQPATDRFDRLSRDWFLTEGVHVPLPQDGACTFAGLGEGTFELLLADTRLDAIVYSGPYVFDRAQIVLDTLEVHPGEAIEREYDLTTSLPGRCDVLVTANGAAHEGMTVVATRAGNFRASDTTSASTDGEGRARLAPLSPGAWRLHVIGYDVPWVWDVPGTLVIAPGRAEERTIDVPLVRGTLMVLDASTHEPWPEAPMALMLGDDSYYTYHPLPVTPSGTIELELAPHTYRFRCSLGGAPVDMPAPDVEWSAAGPAPSTIELRGP